MVEEGCPNCGREKHTERQWAECKADMFGLTALSDREQSLAWPTTREEVRPPLG